MSEEHLWTLSIPVDGTPPKFETSTLLDTNISNPVELVSYFGNSLIELGASLLTSLASNADVVISTPDENDTDEDLTASDEFSYE